MPKYKQLLYAERDPQALDAVGGHYCRHVDHMTGEGLHSKSAIAAELAFRDIRIEQLETALLKRIPDITALTSQLDVGDTVVCCGSCRSIIFGIIRVEKEYLSVCLVCGERTDMSGETVETEDVDTVTDGGTF